MSIPSISVVLPFRNAAATLADAVESIRAQTFRDWELVLFDDGSEDDSSSVASRLARADNRIRVITSPHVGIVGALQRGCVEARGRFIARMDADDLAAPERLERQMALMAADEAMALCGTQVTITGERIGSGRRRYEAWINGLTTHDEIVRELFVECPIPHPAFLMRRDAFDRIGGYEDHGWAEDYDLCMRVFLAGMRFGKVAEPLLEWRDAPGRLSMVNERYSPEQFRALKRHYLLKTYLKDKRRFIQWGAGEVGKLWLREWDAFRPEAVVDINPRKIGRKIHGFPVIAETDLPPPGDAFILVTVGARGARDDIRGRIEPLGYRETVDYLFVA